MSTSLQIHILDTNVKRTAFLLRNTNNLTVSVKEKQNTGHHNLELNKIIHLIRHDTGKQKPAVTHLFGRRQLPNVITLLTVTLIQTVTHGYNAFNTNTVTAVTKISIDHN